MQKQHVLMSHGLQNIKQFASAKLVLISTMPSLKTKLIVNIYCSAAIGNPEWQVRKASHCDSKQQ